MNVNQVVLVGHVTRDPEVKTISTDSTVATFRLAVNRSYKKGDKWIDKPTFVDCEAWNHKANHVADKVMKGTEVYVRGRLEHDEWEKNGEKRSKHKVYVLELQLGKGRRESGAEGNSSEAVDDVPF